MRAAIDLTRRLRWLPALALSTLLAAGAVHAQQQPARASQLLGRLAQNAGGKDIGELRDLVVDTQEGRIAYVVLSVGAFVGGGSEKLVAFPVPSPDVRLNGERLMVTTTRARLAEMPGFTSQEWPDFGAGAPDPATGPRFRRASQMIDTDLKNRDGKDVGDIKDLMVALDPPQLHFVVEFDRSWYDQAGWVALPRQSIRFAAGDLVANFEPSQVRTPEEAEAARRKAEEERAKAAAYAASLDHDERASKVIGKQVVDGAGTVVGPIRDLVVDTRGNRVTHAVVAAGGYLGAGERLVAIPLPIAGATLDGERYRVPTDRQKLAALPGFAPNAWPDFNAGQKGKPVRRVTELLDTKLADYRGKEVGDLRDIVVNLGAGRVRYAVAEFDPNWVQAGKVVAIPFRGVRADEDQSDLRMRADLMQLQGAMIFEKGRWPDIDHPQFRATMDNYLKQTAPK